MTLSTTTKEGIKLATALVLTYGIALAAGWEKPLWAGIAVVVASQATLGQSVARGAMRVVGTVLGVLMAWVVFTLFPQDRWMFMVSLSLWVGLCVYLMQESGSQYFWQVAGFTSLIIWLTAGSDFSASFDKGIERAVETALGVVIYSLVALLVWPIRSRPALDDACINLLNAQKDLSQACFAQLCQKSPHPPFEKLQIAVLEADAKVDGLLRNAVIDSFEVWERRGAWRRYGQQVSKLNRSLMRLSDSLDSLRSLDMHRLLPGLDELASRIELRLIAAERLMAGESVSDDPSPAELVTNTEALRELSAFEIAALSQTRKELLAIDSGTRELLARIRNIVEFDSTSKAQKTVEDKESWSDSLMPDPERLVRVFRVMVGLWLTYLAYIYVPGLPGGAMPVMLVGVLCICLAMLPPLPMTVVTTFIVIALSLAGLIYFFIIIDLTNFYELALFLFAWNFLVYCLLSAPKLQPVRVIVLLLTQVVIGVQNVQEYSFSSYLMLFVVCLIALFIISIVENLPFSNRPEHVFTRGLRSFFRSSAHLMSQPQGMEAGWRGWLASWYRCYHQQIVKRMPRQLAVAARNVRFRQVPGVNEQQLLQMVNLVRLISEQVLILNNTKSRFQSSDLPDDLQKPLNAWLGWGQGVMSHLADSSPAILPHSGGSKAELQSGQSPELESASLGRSKRLVLRGLEGAVEQYLPQGETPLSILPDVALSLNTLGVARHLSDSLEDFADLMEQVDWERFLEARFAS